MAGMDQMDDMPGMSGMADHAQHAKPAPAALAAPPVCPGRTRGVIAAWRLRAIARQLPRDGRHAATEQSCNRPEARVPSFLDHDRRALFGAQMLVFLHCLFAFLTG